MADANDKMREGFDRWAADKWPWAWFRDAAWEGWQAALAEQPTQGDEPNRSQLKPHDGGSIAPGYTAPPAPALPDAVAKDAARWRFCEAHPGWLRQVRKGKAMWFAFASPTTNYEFDIYPTAGEAIDAAMLAAAPEAAAPAVPDGWKLVPAEATEAMVSAVRAGTIEPQGMVQQARIIERIKSDYRKLLTAAPEVKP